MPLSRKSNDGRRDRQRKASKAKADRNIYSQKAVRQKERLMEQRRTVALQEAAAKRK